MTPATDWNNTLHVCRLLHEGEGRRLRGVPGLLTLRGSRRRVVEAYGPPGPHAPRAGRDIGPVHRGAIRWSKLGRRGKRATNGEVCAYTGPT
jgi:hypothetical protein